MKLTFSVALIGILLMVFFMGCNPATVDTKPDPVEKTGQAAPLARVEPYPMTMFGDTRIDNYYWLRNRDEQEVLDYLTAENEYTENKMSHTAQLQEELYREMRSRIKENDWSVPVRQGDYFYYTRIGEGQQYDIHCRKRGSLEADEEILLDENQLAAGQDYFEIGEFQVSPDHKFLAYSVDLNGSEKYTIYFKNLETGELLSERISETYYSLEWANDNQTVFYTRVDEAMRPYQVMRHRINTDPAEDVLVFEEPDDSFFLEVSKTKSKKYLLLSLGSQVTTEFHYLDANDPTGEFTVIHPRQYQMEYYVFHHGDQFYILTNHEALNFRLMTVPVTAPSIENWQELVSHRDDVTLEDVTLFKDFLVILERDYGLRQIYVRNLVSGEDYRIGFHEATYGLSLSDNPDFNSSRLRFKYNSLVTPASIYDYDLVTRERELKKIDEVGGGYDPSQYETSRTFAQTEDGLQVPVSIVYHKNMIRDGSNPVCLYGYGSYGYNTDPRFRSRIYSLVDRGFIYAVAHIRGSSYLGRDWYEDGKLLNKKNTFTDFIAAAHHLIAEKYTRPGRIIAMGGSAGGLLMGAVANMAPELFLGIVAHVPFVDVVTTMLDETIPLTVIEYDEWGNPNNEQYYHYLKSYSPYDNVATMDYPHLLVTAGLNDPRVQYWEPAKWVARLRITKTDDNRLLLKTNMGSGHFGATGRFDYLKEVAFEYAFILDILGSN